MNKEQALHTFWSSFGLNAYDENTVPTGEGAPDYPYITYSVQTGNMDADLMLNASIWYRSTSWENITKKKDEIASAIQNETWYNGGGEFKIDGGYMKIHLPQGSSFAQRMSEPSDNMVRRYLLSIYVEFLTES